MPWTNDRNARRASSATYGVAWRKARKAQLERDSYRCQLQYQSICTYRATQVDHVIGAAADPDHRHLRSACAPCHQYRTATEQGGGYRKAASDPPPRPATTW